MPNQEATVDQNCIICRSPLIYSAESSKKTCELCGNVFFSPSECEKGHYVCDACHSMDAFTVIRNVCKKTKLDDPIAIMEEILTYPQIKLHGPEHHFLVPAAIMTALKNHGEDVHENYLKEIELRASKVPGGTCGFWGACGAAVGVGIAFSVFTRGSPGKKKERQMANWATSVVLAEIADGTEQCCKRATRIAIELACDLLKEKFGIELPHEKNKHCLFSRVNARCNKNECQYYSPVPG